MNQSINISTSTFLRFILIILGMAFLYLIRDVLLMVFIALIIAAAIDGPVDWLARHKVRRVFGAAIAYLLIVAFFALFMYLIVPPLAGQIKLLATDLPDYLTKLGAGVQLLEQKIGTQNLQKLLEKAGDQLADATSNIFGTAVSIFGGIFSAVVIFVISIYLVVQDKAIKIFLSNITPPAHQVYVIDLAERIQRKLGAWLRGQILLMGIVGLMVFVGLTLLKVKFALTLALLAGLFEIIPYAGAVLGATPAVILAFFQSPLLASLVIALFVVVQQLENHLIVPQVMKRAVGLNPLVIIISLIIGGNLAGILGVVVAVPIAAIISVFLSDIFKRGEVA
ncbi:MAG: hypothetical protein LiPW39_21 [Parcubacteria group bacterium LiPW_39]|nr:MAG: hypothetical protein LiPW39_21 [Parcubacteria group bacterium LiPW_39]